MSRNPTCLHRIWHLVPTRLEVGTSRQVDAASAGLEPSRPSCEFDHLGAAGQQIAGLSVRPCHGDWAKAELHPGRLWPHGCCLPGLTGALQRKSYKSTGLQPVETPLLELLKCPEVPSGDHAACSESLVFKASCSSVQEEPWERVSRISALFLCTVPD